MTMPLSRSAGQHLHQPAGRPTLSMPRLRWRRYRHWSRAARVEAAPRRDVMTFLAERAGHRELPDDWRPAADRLADQLRATADALAGRPLDGPYDDSCGCTTANGSGARSGCGAGCSCGTVAGDERGIAITSRV